MQTLFIGFSKFCIYSFCWITSDVNIKKFAQFLFLQLKTFCARSPFTGIIYLTVLKYFPEQNSRAMIALWGKARILYFIFATINHWKTLVCFEDVSAFTLVYISQRAVFQIKLAKVLTTSWKFKRKDIRIEITAIFLTKQSCRHTRTRYQIIFESNIEYFSLGNVKNHT